MPHLDAEQLLDLLYGEAAPPDVESSLQHLDDCLECRQTFDVMVALRVRREEARGALAVARDAEPIPHPVLLRPPVPRWTRTVLRMAASVALAALLGLLALGSPVPPLPGMDANAAVEARLAALASDDLGFLGRESAYERVAATEVQTALEELRSGNARAARDRLEEHVASFPDDETARLYLGVAQYKTGAVEAAVATLRSVEDSADTIVRRMAVWFQANALLSVRRVDEARFLLGRLTAEAAGIGSSDVSGGRVFETAARNLIEQIDEIRTTSGS